MTIERKLWGGVMHMRNWVFHWFMHFKQIYEPRETFGILLSPKITPLPTKPLLSASHKLGPWVTKIIPDLAWFFNGFLLEIWTYTLTFPYVNQGPLLKASKGHIKILGPWCWLFLLHILWLDRDPFFSCMYSGLPEVLFFFLYYYYYCFFFLLFGTLGLHGPF